MGSNNHKVARSISRTVVARTISEQVCYVDTFCYKAVLL